MRLQIVSVIFVAGLLLPVEAQKPPQAPLPPQAPPVVEPPPIQSQGYTFIWDEQLGKYRPVGEGWSWSESEKSWWRYRPVVAPRVAPAPILMPRPSSC